MSERLPLPVDAVVGQIRELLQTHSTLVLEAPPGTGKTTRVPPALLEADWLGDGKVLMLEPRRVAARAAAERIAAECSSVVGELVGLRTRFDTRVGPNTRIEVVTEGVLTRMLIADPGLSGIGAVIFDEFHERSIHADTGLAFVRETVQALREDLRIVVMSATLGATELGARLETDAIITVAAPLYPVELRYRPPAPGRRVDDDTADAVLEAMQSANGDVIVFLAGVGDINRTEQALRKRLPPDVVITPLHGSLPPAEQDRALRRDASGKRKIVLSTPIAETSVTIDGARIVVDSGRRRRPEHDLGRGMSRLRTVNASQAATEQRRGRAGRQAPGLCVRLWPEIEQEHRRADEPPEILTSDLTALALQIAAWGAVDVNELPWLDEPPAAALAAGRGVLTALGAIDDERRLTSHGREVAALGTEPRLAHMMIQAKTINAVATACDVAALLSDRDIMTGRDRSADLRSRVEALAIGGPRVDAGRRGRAKDTARRWRRRFDVANVPAELDLVGPVISLAFPDRIAQRRTEPGSFLLASGTGVATEPNDTLARETFLAVAELDGVAADGRIVLAAPIDRDDLDRLHGEAIEYHSRGEWDRRARDVIFERQERLGALVLRREADTNPDRDALNEALLAGVRREGLGLLRWSEIDRRWRDRLQFLHDHDSEHWPDMSDEALLERLTDWLQPHLGSARRRADLEMLDVKSALNQELDWRQVREVERLAPTHFDVPSGSRIPIDYATEGGPVLAVRLQEVFGLAATPTVLDGKVPLVVHLLSPAHRPVQVTKDLASFWSSGYAEVRKELRGRYPKHEWPEDPTTAPATSKARRRR
ncbi:MAG: ATP-dependent helicase HrpB [Candidatus Aldehydirespiratoraceae bacterium]|jgi:ATP-dependent helicase HrpB